MLSPLFARRALSAALLLSLLAAVAGLALQPVSESDLFFRLKAGQEILARRGLPANNLYSFTYPDHPDLDTAWLFEVGAAWLLARGGFPALVLAKTAVLLATFAGAFVVCRRRGAGPAASALALAAVALAARERFVERPHLFSLAGEVLLLAAIDALTATPETDRRRARRLALAALAATVLWANLHAGVFVAPALLGLAALGTWIDDRRLPKRLLFLTVGAGGAMLATPVGTGLFRYLSLHLSLPALHPVDEFRTASWISDRPLLLLGACAVVAALLVRPRQARVLLPAAALGLLALRSIRFGADFALVIAPIVAVGLTRLGGALRRPVPTSAAAVVVVAALTAWAVGPRVAAARAGRPVLDIALDTSIVPQGAIHFVTDNGLRVRMYNDFEIGAYLLYEGFPRYRVFVDPRLPAYPSELHALLGRGDLSRVEWDAAMAHHGVDSALLAYAGLNRRVAWWDPAGWALVYSAQDARVFVRRLPRYRALIAAHEIPATFSFTPADGTATLPLTERPPASPVADCEWQRRLGDLLFQLDGAASPRVRAAYALALQAPLGCLGAGPEAQLCGWLGAVALQESQLATALALFDRALSRGDAQALTRANRALALEGLGRSAEAVVAWADVAARAVGTPLQAIATKRLAVLRGR